MCMNVLSVWCYVYRVYCMHAWCPQKPEEDTQFPWTGVRDVCEPTFEYWEPNPNALQIQQVLLTTKPCLQLKILIFFEDYIPLT